MTFLSFQQRWLLPAFLCFALSTLSAQHSSYQNLASLQESKPCKVFIGVGTSSVAEGLQVDYTLENTPASTYGVQAGDVIVSLDGVPVRTQTELIRQRNTHQQGEAFTLTILRNGAQQTINAQFKSCTPEQQKKAEENAALFAEKNIERAFFSEVWAGLNEETRPILGVYENTHVSDNGLVISSVVSGKGAEAAGLTSGDVVVMVDGKTVTGSRTLRTALDGHEAGDVVSVSYIRNGQTLKTEITLSADRSYTSKQVERDPCKVFIGVYTSTNMSEGGGLRVSGVIDGTPAKESGVQPGDVIMAFNGHSVQSHEALTGKRDDQKPGDPFTLTVIREGQTMDIRAKFKSCDTPKTPQETEAEITEEAPSAETRTPAQPEPENVLQPSLFNAFPSPTYGPLNIQFEAEAVPTTIRLLDITGRAVYSKNLPRFDGSFSEQVNLSSNKAGNYILSIQQGDRVVSKQIVLLPRA